MLPLNDKQRIQIMIPITELLIRFIGIQRTIQLICNPDRFVHNPQNDHIVNAKLILRALKIGVEQTFWKGNCLSRSIVFQGLLQKNGIGSELCIGVRSKPKFKAHAWVEHKGTPLNAGQQVHFKYQIIKDYQIIQGRKFS